MSQKKGGSDAQIPMHTSKDDTMFVPKVTPRDSSAYETWPLNIEQQKEFQLSVFEKKYLLCSERGDVPAVRNLLQKHKNNLRFNINCTDALGRTALIVAVENENMELIDLLLENGINAGDALLHAISEEYVEAVEVLLHHEEKSFEPNKPYSWETVDHDMATFTKDITPLILAAHRDNYEIIKLLLDRGASLPMPHDVRCGCDDCVTSIKDDVLRHSRSRINAYWALSSPSLICLSSTDPILTAFKLSSELRKLSSAENEFKSDYTKLRCMCQEYATSLLDHTRTSSELEIMLNYNPTGEPHVEGQKMALDRLKMAIDCKQKTFVAHPNVQQLLASVWYEGSPGFRRKGVFGQFLDIAKIGALFPVYSLAYMIAPESTLGQTMKKPFTKFICHSASYCFFLMLLIMASQRVETLLMSWIGTEYFQEKVRLDREQERGKPPGIIESAIIVYVFGFIWFEIKQLWESGLENYLGDMWNIADFFTNMLYLSCIGLRFAAWYHVQRELENGLDAYKPREEWDPYDPMLISEGLFGAANIFSFLKMVHIFSVNPHLGPLQISLGRMVFDIIKFFFIYSLVLFAFASGLNQLLWYYADIDKQLCFSTPDGKRNPDYQESCVIWRRFANLFETAQSLFWASFGLVELENFELTGIKSYTRFWSLLMYGSYSVINVVVLLNLLIAMMSNSYQVISERSDVEWKFARSKLWMSYFESGSTVPPPFNLFPTPKSIRKFFRCQEESHSKFKEEKEKNDNESKYRSVMRCLVRRFVTSQQRKAEETGVTEDDVNEVKQAVNSFRSELFETLRNNGMQCASQNTDSLTRKERLRERRLLKDFNIDLVETVFEALMSDKGRKARFSLIRRVTNTKKQQNSARRNWNAIVEAARRKQSLIGNTTNLMTSSSLADLREQVLKEQEIIKPLSGVQKFVSLAKRARDRDFQSLESIQPTIFKDSSYASSPSIPESEEVLNVKFTPQEITNSSKITFGTNPIAGPKNKLQTNILIPDHNTAAISRDEPSTLNVMQLPEIVIEETPSSTKNGKMVELLNSNVSVKTMSAKFDHSNSKSLHTIAAQEPVKTKYVRNENRKTEYCEKELSENTTVNLSRESLLPGNSDDCKSSIPILSSTTGGWL